MTEFEAEKLGAEAYRNGESFNSNPFDRDKKTGFVSCVGKLMET